MKLAIVCSLLISHYCLLLLLRNENCPTYSLWMEACTVVPVEEYFDIINLLVRFTATRARINWSTHISREAQKVA